MAEFLDFLNMGGYAFYVWLSYGVVAAVLVYHTLAPLIRRRKLLAELANELRSPQAEFRCATPSFEAELAGEPPPPSARSAGR